MDELFSGTEEEVERMYAAALTMHCKLSDIFCSAREEMVTRWKRSDGVQVSFDRLNLPAVSADTLQNSGIDAGIKLRPTNEELSSMSPEFSHRWSTYFANAPDKPVMLALPFRSGHLILISTDIHLLPALLGDFQTCLVDNTSV